MPGSWRPKGPIERVILHDRLPSFPLPDGPDRGRGPQTLAGVAADGRMARVPEAIPETVGGYPAASGRTVRRRPKDHQERDGRNVNRQSQFQWIIDRARSGEPVPIDRDRRDIGRVIDFLSSVDGTGLSIQLDTIGGIMWVVRSDLE